MRLNCLTHAFALGVPDCDPGRRCRTDSAEAMVLEPAGISLTGG